MTPIIYILIFILGNVDVVSVKDVPYRNFTTLNELPQIQVRHVYQDRLGYIWIGTKGGVAKHNGDTFETFLENDHIFNITGDSIGQVYIVSTSGLYRYDGVSMDRLKISNSRTDKIYPFGTEGYIISDSEGIQIYRSDSLITNFNVKDQSLFKSISPRTIYDSKNGKVYFITPESKTVYSLSISGAVDTVCNIAGDGIINLELVGTTPLICNFESSNRLSYIDITTEDTIINFDLDSKQSATNCSITRVPKDKFIILDRDSQDEYSYIVVDSLTNSYKKIQFPFIKAAYPLTIDLDNNYWAGSDNGVYHIWNDLFKIYPRSFMNDFWTIIKGKDGSYYGAAYKQGLYKLDFTNQKKEEIIAPGDYDRKEINYYYGASKNREGELFFPTHHGTVKYNYRSTKKYNTGISLISRYDSIEDKIILGQMNGLAFLDKDDNIEVVLDTTKQIVPGHPVSLIENGDSTIWVGTGRSLSIYSRKTKQFYPATERYNNVPSNAISFGKDYRDNIWIGSRDGLLLYNSKTDSISKIEIPNFSGYISSILPIDRSYLIMGTTREVFILDIEQFYCNGEIKIKQYNYNNGMMGEEIAQSGLLRDGDKVLIPTTTYTLELDLKQIKFNSLFYDVNITHINNKPIAIKDLALGKTIHIAKSINNLAFNFSPIGFGHPSEPIYRYRLLGDNDRWSSWDRKTEANFHNLPSGEYTFQVETKHGGLIDPNETESCSVTVMVSMPFYKEPYFFKYSFFLLLALGIVVIYILYLRHKLIVKVEKDQKLVQYLKVATLQANLNPHFIFNLLATVQNLIGQNKPEIANRYLIKFSRLIRAYMESSIKSSKIGLEDYGRHDISIEDEIDLLRMYIEFEEVKYKKKQFKYEITVSSPSILSHTIPPMILQPFVENSIKHGIYNSDKFCQLSINFESADESIICTIKDDGIGREKAAEIKKQQIKIYESRGVELIMKRIDILNQMGTDVKIEYYDPEEGGTVVKIYFNSIL